MRIEKFVMEEIKVMDDDNAHCFVGDNGYLCKYLQNHWVGGECHRYRVNLKGSGPYAIKRCDECLKEFGVPGDKETTQENIDELWNAGNLDALMKVVDCTGKRTKDDIEKLMKKQSEC